jgi:hypothetical protein
LKFLSSIMRRNRAPIDLKLQSAGPPARISKK